MNKILITFLIFFLFSAVANDKLTAEDEKFFKKQFPRFNRAEFVSVEDKVSDEKNNKQLIVLYQHTKRLGFVRKINTSTGCNSACLPIVYSAFYNAEGEYIKLISRVGLTKIFHAPFTDEDLSRLDLLLAMAPKVFSDVTHPKEMTDAISGETFKKYKESVVEGAAYSTLRIHLYHQESLKHIKSYLKSNP